MADLQWFDRSQPQTLQGAVIFCYLTAALAVLTALVYGGSVFLAILLIPVLLLAGCAFGIANDRRIGYWGAVVLSCLYLLLVVISFFTGNFGVILNLLLAGVLVGLLLHPQSRQYQRVWFH